MGKIYFNTLLLFIVCIIFFILTYKYFHHFFEPFIYFTILFVIFVILPFYKSYRNFHDQNKPIIQESICSTCNFFDKNNVYCIKHDTFVQKDYIPCNGNDYEPYYETTYINKGNQ